MGIYEEVQEIRDDHQIQETIDTLEMICDLACIDLDTDWRNWGMYNIETNSAKYGLFQFYCGMLTGIYRTQTFGVLIGELVSTFRAENELVEAQTALIDCDWEDLHMLENEERWALNAVKSRYSNLKHMLKSFMNDLAERTKV